MYFPERPYDDIAAYADAYLARLNAAAASVDRASLARAAEILKAAYERGATVFACGNGGSAAISNHLVCDHVKGVQTDTALHPRVVSLSSNIELVTAIANDISYANVFSYQVRSLAKAGDVLITISSSGDSENVVQAAQWARDNGVAVVAMSGFTGGRTAKIADVDLHVHSDNYGVIEDVHQSLMHILAQFLRQAHMDAKLVPDRKF
jgi:D-sedoheptulose 7-phosphate isomerase